MGENDSNNSGEKALQGGMKKDFWDRFSTLSTFLSTVVIAAIGLIFTYNFNALQGNRDYQTRLHQMRILEMQTVEKFIPHLTADEKTKEIALLALTSLGSPEFATRFAQLSPSEGSEAATDKIMRTAEPVEQRQISRSIQPPELAAVGPAAKTVKTGWAYIGHFVGSKKAWKTRYFDIGERVNPKSLVGKTLTVREETGSLNVRKGMPTFTGSFKPVIGSLKPGGEAKILKINEWSSSGYMWAYIEAVPGNWAGVRRQVSLD